MKRGLVFSFLLLAACGPDEELGRSSFALSGTVPVYPSGAPSFFVLSDGTDLAAYDTQHLLGRRTGLGNTFKDETKYRSLKQDSKVLWIVRDLDTGGVFAESSNSSRNVYGASVSKALVVAALLDKQKGVLTSSQWQKVFRLLVLSDNDVWSSLETMAGGKAGVRAFTQKMGYAKTQGDRSGNQINALELSDFLYDVHHLGFPGAEALLKVMSACNTGAAKSRKYLPKTIFLGGKTGTWNQYYHDMKFVEIEGKRYAVVVLTEKGTDENVAIMFGGLVREYLLDPAHPPVPRSWIGGACSSSDGCLTGDCLAALPEGMCTESCTRLCPDASGQAETFCVTFDPSSATYTGSQGSCFARCDTSKYAKGCRAGYVCVKTKRHKESSVKRNVCLPEGKPDSVGEAPDEEGDLPNPETLEQASQGCSTGSGPTRAPWLLGALLVLGLAGVRRRGRGARALLLLAPVLLLSCGDDSGEEQSWSAAIVNGQLDSGHPAVGRLDFDNGLCSGTLIASQAVLTAAHCIEGAKSATFTVDGSKYVVSKMLPRSDYDADAVTNDLAVLLLSKSVAGVQPVRLSRTPPKVGQAITLVGFGITKSSRDDAGVKRKASNVIGSVDSQHLSYHGSSGSKGNICSGDSGGPSLRSDSGEDLLVGVHSTASLTCGADGNDMRVDPYVSWIESQAAGELPGPAPTPTPTPAAGAMWIGEGCGADGDCASKTCLGQIGSVVTFAGGMCTQSCTKLCPDKQGAPVTFCVSFDVNQGAFGGAQGQCFSRCDTSLGGSGCRTGYACVKMPRHNDSSVKRNVCLPAQNALLAGQTLGEPPDVEGDQPSPEQGPAESLPTIEHERSSAGGCAVPAEAPPAPGPCTLLLLGVVLLGRARASTAPQRRRGKLRWRSL